MARQVYFDPFGSYVNAYDKGIGRQMELEQNTRAARREDAMFPLQHRELQRKEELGIFGMPYMKNALQYADRGAKNTLFDQDASLAMKYPGQMMGVTAPFENTVNTHYNITPQNYQTQHIPNESLLRARQQYNQGVAGLFPGQDYVDPDQWQLAQSELARQIADNTGLDIFDVMSNLPRQDTEIQDVNATDYFMQGPNGQPVRVGGMIDPRQRLLEQWQNPQQMQLMEHIYKIQQQGYDNQLRRQQADTYRWQTELNANNPRGGGAAGGNLPDY